jgi:hypothetical protein
VGRPSAAILGIAAVLLVAGCRPPASLPADPPAPSAASDDRPGPEPARSAPTVAPTVAAIAPNPSLWLRFGDRAWEATARELGVRLVPAAPVGLGTGPSSPTQAPVLGDGGLLEAAIRRASREVERAPRDAQLRLEGGRIQFIRSAPGLAVDVAATRERILRALAEGRSTTELAARELPPAVSDEQLRPAREQLERLLLAGEDPALTLAVGERRWSVPRSDVRAMVVLSGGTGAAGPPRVSLDQARVSAIVERAAREVDEPALDARFAWNGGRPSVLRESRPGRALDRPAAARALETALLTGRASVDLPVRPLPPTVASGDVAALAVLEPLGEATTPLAGSIP